MSSFPRAWQPQIIRAQQRDLIHEAGLRENLSEVLRHWFGTRALSSWDKELDLFVSILYYGLCTWRGAQTIGEEYTDIWHVSRNLRRRPGDKLRAALVLLPAFSAYIFNRSWNKLVTRLPKISGLHLPELFRFVSELNMAVFYFRGDYYDIFKRLLGIKYISTFPRNPNARPQSYALLGVLIIVRLVYQTRKAFRSFFPSSPTSTSDDGQPLLKNAFIDTTPLSAILQRRNSVNPSDIPKESNTILSLSHLDTSIREHRKCALCLEERTATTVTECGHLYCWECITSWGREKAECPLCRQSLELRKLLPLYNI